MAEELLEVVYVSPIAQVCDRKIVTQIVRFIFYRPQALFFTLPVQPLTNCNNPGRRLVVRLSVVMPKDEISMRLLRRFCFPGPKITGDTFQYLRCLGRLNIVQGNGSHPICLRNGYIRGWPPPPISFLCNEGYSARPRGPEVRQRSSLQYGLPAAEILDRLGT